MRTQRKDETNEKVKIIEEKKENKKMHNKKSLEILLIYKFTIQHHNKNNM